MRSSTRCGSTPRPLCSDEEFLRRASIDICGVLPTSDEYRSFMASPDPEKRLHLVDQLLARKEFVDLWVMKWSELLMIRTVPNEVSYKAMLLYVQLAAGADRGQHADRPAGSRAAVGQGGHVLRAPATNYFQHERDTLKTAENVAQVFMGMRIQCAQCHNHPFDRWTMDDYYGFANFFAQIGRKQRRGSAGDDRLQFRRTGDVKHPVGGRVVPPKFLGGGAPDVDGQGPPRGAGRVARFSGKRATSAVTSSTSSGPTSSAPASSHEVDDVRVSNPPVNKPLLDVLARRFVESKYDLKRLVRDICTSHAYQRSTIPNETNADGRAELLQGAAAADPGRGASRHGDRRHRHARTSSRACRSGPGPSRSPTATRAPISSPPSAGPPGPRPVRAR